MEWIRQVHAGADLKICEYGPLNSQVDQTLGLGFYFIFIYQMYCLVVASLNLMESCLLDTFDMFSYMTRKPRHISALINHVRLNFHNFNKPRYY